MSANAYTKKAQRMKDQELYSFFSEAQFYNDPELTKAVCQELANREAARLGIEPPQIEFDDLQPGVLGAAGNGQVLINTGFLKRTIPQILKPAKVLNTIIHETRHIWQDHVLSTDDPKVPLSVKLLLFVDHFCYCGVTNGTIDIGLDPKLQAFLEYALQENEMDARFYAFARMSVIESSMEMDDNFRIELEAAKQTELSRIKAALTYIDEEKYRLLEEKRMERYNAISEELFRKTGHRLPELPANFRCYQNIWMIRNIISPVFDFFLEEIAEIRQNALSADNLLFGLYAIARNCAAEGKPLEQPEELLQIVMRSKLCKEFNLKQSAIPEKWGKPVGI